MQRRAAVSEAEVADIMPVELVSNVSKGVIIIPAYTDAIL